MARGKFLTDDEKSKIIELYKQGLPIKDIAEKVGRAESAVYRTTMAAGLSRKGKNTPRRNSLTPQQNDTAIKKFKEGLSVGAIARLIGRNKSVVYQALRKTGAEFSRNNPRPKSNGMARGQPPMLMTSTWQGQLTKLVARIRRVDPGVIDIELDIQNGRFTVNRNTSERGSL